MLGPWEYNGDLDMDVVSSQRSLCSSGGDSQYEQAKSLNVSYDFVVDKIVPPTKDVLWICDLSGGL